jgi:predicted nucleotidyltransferase
MAAKKTEIINIVKRLIKALEKKNIVINEAYLFGSYAQGTFAKYSDIDVALISDAFTGVRFLDIKKIGRTVRNIDYRIEIHPFSSWDKDESFFYHEIINSGIKVA